MICRSLMFMWSFGALKQALKLGRSLQRNQSKGFPVGPLVFMGP